MGSTKLKVCWLTFQKFFASKSLWSNFWKFEIHQYILGFKPFWVLFNTYMLTKTQRRKNVRKLGIMQGSKFEYLYFTNKAAKLLQAVIKMSILTEHMSLYLIKFFCFYNDKIDQNYQIWWNWKRQPTELLKMGTKMCIWLQLE